MKKINFDIESTFLHLPDIGRIKERLSWASGILTWRDCLDGSYNKRLFNDKLISHLKSSVKALKENNFDYFAQLLPNKDIYRLAISKPENVLFLDIETTGLSIYYDYITMVGWSINGEYNYFISGVSSEVEFFDAVEKAKVIVTFNGKVFDIPFLKKKFKSIKLPEAHVDLRYLSRSCGLKGGQKLIENKIGFKRSKSLQATDGYTATIFWDEYKWGKKSSLEKLIRYNHSDIEGMKAILDYCINYDFLNEGYDEFFMRPYSFFALKSNYNRQQVNNFAQNSNIPFDKKSVLNFNSLAKGINQNFKIVGVDLTGREEKPSGIAFIENKNVNTFLLKKDSEIIDLIKEFCPDIVSIDSPLSLPKGRSTPYDTDPFRKKYGIIRICEKTLKKRGVNVYPSLIPSMQKLTARGIKLATELRKQGIPVIESYPGVVQDIIGLPRKQASQTLLKKGLGIFGLHGDFLRKDISHDELDAITSAIVGIFFLSKNFEAIGCKSENFMVIPDLHVTHNNRLIIGVAGSIASGKTTVAKQLERKGFFYIRYSEVLAKELVVNNKEITRENLQNLGAKYKNCQYKLCDKIKGIIKDKKYVVIDGVRNNEDYTYWYESYGLDFKLLFLDADKQVREHRYYVKNKEHNYAQVILSSTESEVEKIKSLANEIISNSGNESELNHQVEKVLINYGA